MIVYVLGQKMSIFSFTVGNEKAFHIGGMEEEKATDILQAPGFYFLTAFLTITYPFVGPGIAPSTRRIFVSPLTSTTLRL